jgi:RNA polymerase sigma-70 factor (ECF subfamily)
LVVFLNGCKRGELIVNRRLVSRSGLTPDLPAGLAPPLLRAVSLARRGEGSEESFGELDAALRPRLRRYFESAGFSPEDAQDLVQKTLVRVFKGIGGLREEEKFLAWLFSIARNVLRTAVVERREAARMSLPLEAVADVPDGADGPAGRGDEKDRETRIAAVWRAIERLPLRQRQCLPLQIRDELSTEEIAATLRLSVNTVRNHLAAARKSLRRILELDEGA